MKHWYPLVTKVSKDQGLVFMNYGYLDEKLNDSTLSLDPMDEDDRYCIQLYHHVVSHIDLKNKDVLEVSSGHGGGASYISRYLKPKSYTGLERNPKAVEFCNEHHKVTGLSFVEGDATNIHLADESVDAVVNVEASHIYPEPQKFFDGVARVLRSGGHFLTTDFRPRDQLDQWKGELNAAGLKIVREEDITKNVLKAMDEMDEMRMNLVDSVAPKFLHHWFKQFAGLKGSKIYESFVSGNTAYMSFTLQKESN